MKDTKNYELIYDISDFNYYILFDGIYAILKKAHLGIKNYINPIIKNNFLQQLIMSQVLKLVA